LSTSLLLGWAAAKLCYIYFSSELQALSALFYASVEHAIFFGWG